MPEFLERNDELVKEKHALVYLTPVRYSEIVC